MSAWDAHSNVGVVEAVTGSGKSLVGILAAARAVDNDMAVIIVVPKKVLQEQWIAELKKYFTGYGVIGGLGGEYGNLYNWRSSKPQPGKIVVAVVNTLANNLDLHPDASVKTLLIADEVHNYSGESFRKILNNDFVWRLGLTATLEPQDGRYFVFARYFGSKAIYSYGYKQALADKCVSSYSVMLIRVELNHEKLQQYSRWSSNARYFRQRIIEETGISFDHDKIHREIAELREKKISLNLINSWEEAMDAADAILAESDSKASAVRQVASLISERGNTIIFSDSTRLAEMTQNLLHESGVPSAIIKAGVPHQMREFYFRQIKNQGIKALISPKALDEGVNLESLSAGLFVGVRRRRLQLIQRLGRVLRIEEGKARPLIIIPVNRETWEDPYLAGNSKLIHSSLNFIVENAETVHAVDVSQTEEIRRIIDGYKLEEKSELSLCA
jgi:RNA polymerase primary sigma factor